MDLSLDWGQSTLNVLVTSTGRNFYTENKLAAANILEKKLWAKQWVPKPELSIIVMTWWSFWERAFLVPTPDILN